MSKFKQDWIEDAMEYCGMSHAQALHSWEQQEYRDQ